MELLNYNYVLIGTIYHSPTTNPNVSISKLCCILKEVIESRPPYLLIAGDFNLPGSDWSDDNFSGNSYEQNSMIQFKNVFYFSMLMSQHISDQVHPPMYWT